MKGTRKSTLLMTVAALAASSPAVALISPDELKMKAEKAVERFRAENPQATEVLDSAAGILVCPKIREIGLIFGFERGACVLRQGGETKAFYRSTGVKWGLTAGFESHVLLLAFNSEKALGKFTNTKREWEIGIDAGVSVAKMNASGELDTTSIRKPVVAFVYGQRGLMLDVSVEGSRFKRLDRFQIREGGDALVRVVAIGKLPGGSAGNKIEILIDRWSAPGERIALHAASRNGGAEELRNELERRPTCGRVRAPGMDEAVDLRYARPERKGDEWRIVLATSKPLGAVASWARQKGAEHDVTLMEFVIDDNHEGEGKVMLGTKFIWDETGTELTVDHSGVPPIEVEVSAYGAVPQVASN